MPKLVKNGEIVENDSWTLIQDSDAKVESNDLSDTIVPLEQYLALESDVRDSQNIGIFLNNDCDLEAIDSAFLAAPIIAINFPGFMDGRGFSLARMLRDTLDYKGTLRAVGYIIPDQLYYLGRCGFNEFSFDDDIEENTIVECLHAFSNSYQAASDDPQPLFRRRA